VDEIVSGIDDLRPADEIVREMTARYLLHAVKNENDQRALFALALARGDRDVLRAMLRPDTDVDFDLTARLAQLERDYASVHFKEARLQDEPSFFLHERLRSMRDEGWVNKLNQHAVDAIRRRMARREEDLPRAEDRCGDEDWLNDAIQLTDHLFWLDESHAWRWITPCFVEGLAYSRELRDGLLSVAESWQRQLSKAGKTRVKIFRNGHSQTGDINDQSEMLEQLDRLSKLGWLRDGGDDALEAERNAIIDLWRGWIFYERKQNENALEYYERAETGLPRKCELLRQQLAEYLNLLAS